MWERACSRKRWVSHFYAGYTGIFAGKPAPTGGGGVCKCCVHLRPRGSELARDGVNEDAALLVLELRRALGHEGRHAFLLILRCKRRVEDPTFEPHAFGQADFKGAIDAFLDHHADGH